jgi:uncharacterized UBP type Zn finger protein
MCNVQPSELEKSCECGNNTATVTHKLVTLPRVLILHLKRFKANIDARTYSKCFTEIKPDTLIDLGTYIALCPYNANYCC